MKQQMIALIAAACGTVASAQAPAIPAAEQEAIIKVALDYGEGYYSGAAERMERALHPDLNKVVVSALPQTGKYVVRRSTYSGLIEQTRAGFGFVAPEQRKIHGYVLAVNGDVACAKVTSAMFNDFLSMVRVDGRWWIVNVLWTPGPDAPNRAPVPAVDSLKDKDAITGAARDFIRGVLTSDAALLEKVLHPEVSVAIVSMLQTRRQAINRQGYSALVEPARANLIPAPPEEARAAEIKLIDVMDGMAFVEITAANSLLYVQMAALDGQWKILNVLIGRQPPPE